MSRVTNTDYRDKQLLNGAWLTSYRYIWYDDCQFCRRGQNKEYQQQLIAQQCTFCETRHKAFLLKEQYIKVRCSIVRASHHKSKVLVDTIESMECEDGTISKMSLQRFRKRRKGEEHKILAMDIVQPRNDSASVVCVYDILKGDKDKEIGPIVMYELVDFCDIENAQRFIYNRFNGDISRFWSS